MVTVAGMGWAVVRFFAPSWMEQQIATSRTVAELKAAAQQSSAIHSDLARLNGTLEVIAKNTEATHRATVEMSEKVGELAERVSAVEAVQDVTGPRAPVRTRGRK